MYEMTTNFTNETNLCCALFDIFERYSFGAEKKILASLR